MTSGHGGSIRPSWLSSLWQAHVYEVIHSVLIITSSGSKHGRQSTDGREQVGSCKALSLASPASPSLVLSERGTSSQSLDRCFV